MLAYLRAMLAYLEGNVGPSWVYVGPGGLCCPMLTHLEPLDPKNGKKWEQQKIMQNAGYLSAYA